MPLELLEGKELFKAASKRRPSRCRRQKVCLKVEGLISLAAFILPRVCKTAGTRPFVTVESLFDHGHGLCQQLRPSAMA